MRAIVAPKKTAAELELESRFALAPELKIGRKTIRAGDVISIDGYGYARTTIVEDGGPRMVKGWKVLGFRDGAVHVFGAVTAARAPAMRVFALERIRPRRR